MATIRSFMGFNQSELNFYSLFKAMKDVAIYTDRSFNIYGHSAEDVYSFDKASDFGSHYGYYFFGKDLFMTDNKRLFAGTVTMIAETFAVASLDYDSWLMADFNVAATDFYVASLSKSTNDDTALMKKIMSRADDFQLGYRDDSANGWNGNDNMVGGRGDDTLTGGNGHDTLRGGDDHDTLFLDAGRDFIAGNLGSDTVVATGRKAVKIDLNIKAAQDTGRGLDKLISIENVTGGDGNDQLSGTGGSNTLSGGKGNDRLDGRAGSDVIAGGHGKDTLTGGAGVDHFIFTSVDDMGVKLANSDLITDFRARNELIDLQDVDGSFSRSLGLFNDDGQFNGSDNVEVIARKIDRAGTASDLTVIHVDTDGDLAADGFIRLRGLHDLTDQNFVF